MEASDPTQQLLLGGLASLHCALTPRELECVSLLFLGMDVATMARELDLAIDTVKVHLSAAYRKAGVHSATELVAKAYKETQRCADLRPATGSFLDS